MANRRFLYFAVFSSGMTGLAVEMAASRLLGPAFGVSNLVWASIIGLILIYLTVGYFIGGRWADRSPYWQTMYTVMAWGAFTTGFIPVIARPVLLAAANAFDNLQIAVLAGSFTAVLVLFSIPVTLLGTISPFAIRMAIEDPAQSGSISGRIYAISTLGSFIGTFLPVLVLIPTIGTFHTFLIFSLFLNIVALAGLWITNGFRRTLIWAWMPVVLIVVAIFGGRGPLKETTGQIYETESTYNYIQVLDLDGYHLLRLNEGLGVHSIWKPGVLNYSGPWQQFLAAPFFNKSPYPLSNMKSMAIVGLAAGTVANQATAVYGPIPIDGFEIDPEIIQVGREYFGMTEPNLDAIAEDGRWGLEHSQKKYSLIAIDAYRPPYIPWHLTTKQFFEEVRAHLEADGSLAINVGRASEDRRLIDGLASTMQAVFPSVYVMDVPDSFNSIIYATMKKTNLIDFYVNYGLMKQAGKLHPLLADALEKVIANLRPTPSQSIVYTDDLAPIEWVTNDMVVNFVLFGDMQYIQK